MEQTKRPSENKTPLKKSIDSLKQLEESRNMLLETEYVANNTVNMLQQQRNQTKGILSKLDRLKQEIMQSNNILTRMLSFWKK